MASEEWARLPDARGFAARVHLTEDTLVTDTVLRLQLSDPEGFDAYLAGLTPDNAADAADNRLVLVMAELDADEGKVVLRNGLPALEILSIVSRTALAGPPYNTFDYQVLRARMDTFVPNTADTTDPDDPTRNRSWRAGDQGWILPLVNFVAVTHPLITAMVRGTDIGRLQLVAYTRAAEDVSDPIPERSFQLPTRYDDLPKITWASPATSPFTAPTSGVVDVDITVSDNGGNIVRFSLSSRLEDEPPVTHIDAEFPQVGTYHATQSITLAGNGDHRLQARARDSNGNEAVSLLTVSVPAVAGGGPGVTFAPGSTDYATRLCVTVTVDSGRFNGIAWRVTPPQANQPSVFAITQGTSTVICVDSTSYIWVSGAMNGHAPEAPVFASYVRVS